jgi:hypothetical protein
MKMDTQYNKNFWDTARAILRCKFIAINVYIKNVVESQGNNPTMHLKKKEKQE